MEIKSRNAGGYIILELEGSLDIYTSTEFRNYLEKSVNSENNKVVIDMSKLKYVDSSGIGMLIKEHNFVKELKGDFKIANLKPHIEKVFSVAGLKTYFQILTESEFRANYL
jgi:anti-sigma B factor antagonist